MSDEMEKQGLIKKLFGKKKSSCCSIEFEEIRDEAEEIPQQEEKPRQRGCCCQPPRPSGGTDTTGKS